MRSRAAQPRGLVPCLVPVCVLALAGLAYSVISSGESSGASAAASAASTSGRTQAQVPNVMTEAKSVRFAFEVFGRVQGVYFRKFTHAKAVELGLVGWVKNTADGTVVGEAEGPRSAAEELKYWLRNVGSPSSRIERAEFRSLEPGGGFSTFRIVREGKADKEGAAPAASSSRAAAGATRARPAPARPAAARSAPKPARPTAKPAAAAAAAASAAATPAAPRASATAAARPAARLARAPGPHGKQGLRPTGPKS